MIFAALDVLGVGRDIKALQAAAAAMDVSDDAIKLAAKADDAGAEGGVKAADEGEGFRFEPPARGAGDAAGAVGDAAEEMSFFETVQRMEAHVNAENIGLQEAVKVGDREYFEMIGMSESEIRSLLDPSTRNFAATYGKAMERAVADSCANDPDLGKVFIDAHNTPGKIFATRPPATRKKGQRDLKPDFGFSGGAAQGHIADLTTPEVAAEKAEKYHDRVIVLTYDRGDFND
jgi:hypothetical protein